MDKIVKLLGQNPKTKDVLDMLETPSVYDYLRSVRGGLELILQSSEFKDIKLTKNEIKLLLSCASDQIGKVITIFDTVQDIKNIGNEPD
jgi:hypothetical protein